MVVTPPPNIIQPLLSKKNILPDSLVHTPHWDFWIIIDVLRLSWYVGMVSEMNLWSLIVVLDFFGCC